MAGWGSLGALGYPRRWRPDGARWPPRPTCRDPAGLLRRYAPRNDDQPVTASVPAGRQGASGVLEDDLFLFHVDAFKNYAEAGIHGLAETGHAAVDERPAVGALKHSRDFHGRNKSAEFS